MPIRRYVRAGAFGPEAIATMGEAFEGAVAALDIGYSEMKRDAVAQFIIQLATFDDTLSATALRDKAVEALGGRKN